MPPEINQSESTLRITIDEQWTADEMAESLRIISDLYNIHVVAHWDLRHQLRRASKHLMHGDFEFFEFGSFPCLPFWNPANVPFAFQPELSADAFSPMSAALRIARETDHPFFTSPLPPLKVVAIRYGSPGFKDLAGAGEIIGHLKDFLQWLVNLFVTSKERKAHIEEMQLSNEERRKQLELLDLETRQKQLQLATEYVAFLRDNGFTKKQIRALIQGVMERSDTLSALVETGKITSASIVDHSG